MTEELLTKLDNLITLGSVACGLVIGVCVAAVIVIFMKFYFSETKSSENYKQFNLDRLHREREMDKALENDRFHSVWCRLSKLEDSTSLYESRIYCNTGRIEDLEKQLKNKKVNKK